MVTTFDSREVSRDGLVALFVANGSWQKVFGYYPTKKEIDGQWPLMIVNAVGTLQSMEGETMNPSTFFFVITSFVATEDNAAWETPAAANLVDTLGQTYRQIIRNNAAAASFANSLNFSPTQSNVSIIELHGVNYLSEMWLLEAHLASGSI